MRNRKDILTGGPDGATHYCPYLDQYYSEGSRFPEHKVVSLRALKEVAPDIADAVLQYPSYFQYCERAERTERFPVETWAEAFTRVWQDPRKVAPAPTVSDTLTERGKRYGDFAEHARITRNIKRAMMDSPNWPHLTDSQAEALDMIAHKIGRILNGDPSYADSWHDIAGYAQLVEQQHNQE